MYFPNNACQGEPQRIFQLQETGKAGVCQTDGSISYFSGCEGGKYVKAYFADTACSVFVFSAFHNPGQCVHSASDNSAVYLCSVNDTITAPVTFHPFSTVLRTSHEECYSPNNCTDDVPVYVTYYADISCDAASAENSYGDITSANFSYGQCFYDDGSEYRNVKYTCDGSFYRVDYYQSGACDGEPFESYLRSKACVAEIRKEPIFYRKYTCPAIPTDAPTYTPTDAPEAPAAHAATPTPASSGLSTRSSNLAILGLVVTVLLGLLL
jgi:hypothetical protein